jgi:hypothetical protein
LSLTVASFYATYVKLVSKFVFTVPFTKNGNDMHTTLYVRLDDLKEFKIPHSELASVPNNECVIRRQPQSFAFAVIQEICLPSPWVVLGHQVG